MKAYDHVAEYNFKSYHTYIWNASQIDHYNIYLRVMSDEIQNYFYFWSDYRRISQCTVDFVISFQ